MNTIYWHTTLHNLRPYTANRCKQYTTMTTDMKQRGCTLQVEASCSRDHQDDSWETFCWYFNYWNHGGVGGFNPSKNIVASSSQEEMERQNVWSHQLELLDITVSGPCFHSAPCFARIHRRTSDLLQELAPSHLQTRGQVAGWGAKKTYHTTWWIGSPCQCYKLGSAQKPWGTQSYSSQKHIQWTNHIQTTINTNKVWKPHHQAIGPWRKMKQPFNLTRMLQVAA